MGTSAYNPSNGNGTTTRNMSLAQGLAWFSIGLGLVQLAAPRSVARFIGVEDDDRTVSLMRALGMRELASGVGILSQRGESQWLWGRVAGDAMDLALLGSAMGSSTNPPRTAAAAAAVLGVALLDVAVATSRSRDHHREASRALGDDAPGLTRVEDGIQHVVKSITINKPLDEVMQRWRRAEERPGVLPCLEDHEVDISAGPRGQTEIRVNAQYEADNKLGRLLATLRRRNPGQQIAQDLKHFRQILETGEIVHSDASVHRGLHPARPSEENRTLAGGVA